MYDELIAALRFCDNGECDGCCKYIKGKGTECYTLLRDAADAIEELSKQVELEHQSGFADGQIAANRKKLRWIPVTERLPGREWVLCKCRANIHEVLSLRDGYWYHDPQHQYMSGFVTHWMPLPEPPKEEA